LGLQLAINDVEEIISSTITNLDERLEAMWPAAGGDSFGQQYYVVSRSLYVVSAHSRIQILLSWNKLLNKPDPGNEIWPVLN
jgi:hypothetical protein